MVSGIVVAAPRSGDISWFERRSCRSKVRYATRRDARSAARQFGRRVRDHLRAYGCDFCAGWHVGHPMGAR